MDESKVNKYNDINIKPNTTDKQRVKEKKIKRIRLNREKNIL